MDVYKSSPWLVSKNLCLSRVYMSMMWVSHCVWPCLSWQHTLYTCLFSMSLDILSLWGRSWTHGAFLPNSMCVDFITSFLVDIILYAFMLRKLSRSHGISLGREPWVIVFHFSRFCSMWLFFWFEIFLWVMQQWT